MRLVFLFVFFLTVDAFALSELDCRDHNGKVLYSGWVLGEAPKPLNGSAHLVTNAFVFTGQALNLKKHTFSYFYHDDSKVATLYSSHGSSNQMINYAKSFMNTSKCLTYAAIYNLRIDPIQLGCATFRYNEIELDTSLRFIDSLNQPHVLNRLSPGIRCQRIIPEV